MTSPSSSDRYLVLVEFAYKHLDFQMAELESVLEMNGITLGSDECQIVPLPVPEQSPPKSPRSFVILSFPAKDAERLSSKNNEGIDKWDHTTKIQKTSGIGEMLTRCTLVRSIVELWHFVHTHP